MNSSRWLKFLAPAAIGVALYGLAGVVLGPDIAERRLHRVLAPTGAAIRVATTRVNPFTLSAEFDELALAGPDGEPWLASGRLRARLDPLGLLGRGLDLAQVTLERPVLALDRAPAERLARWLAEGADGLSIDAIGVRDGSLRIAPAGETLVFEGIVATGSGLDHAPKEPGRVSIEARHPFGGRLAVTAEAGLDPLAATGSFEFELAELRELLDRLDSTLGVANGRITARGAFALGGAERPGLALSGVSLDARAIEFHDPAGSRWLRLDLARLSEASIDLDRRSVHAAGVSVDGGTLVLGDASRERGRTLIEHPGIAAWALSVERFQARGLRVDGSAGARPQWRLRGLELELNGFDSGASTRATFTAATTLVRGGNIGASGWLNPAARELEANATLNGLELAAFSPIAAWLREMIPVAGTVDAEAIVGYRAGGLTLEGGVNVREPALVHRAEREPAFSATGVELSGIAARGWPPRGSIARARLSEPTLNLRLDGAGRLRPVGLPGLDAPVPLTIALVEVAGGALTVTDARFDPPLAITTTAIGGTVRGLGARPEGRAEARLEGRLGVAGAARLHAAWRPGPARRDERIELSLAGIDQSLLDRYGAHFAGRGVVAGVLDLDLRYRSAGTRHVGRSRWSFRDLRLAPAGDDARLPLDLAVALHRDDAGRVELTIPLAGVAEAEDSGPAGALGEGAAAYLARLNEAPFEVLAALVGMPDLALGELRFEPGSAAIDEGAERRLAALRDALERRPAIALRIAGGYDPSADRAALARAQVRLHISLATSAGPAAGGPVAFADPKVQSVLDEFAGERLSATELAAIDKRFGGGDRAAYFQAVFEALVAAEPIPDSALAKLARFRSQAVVARLAELGVAAERLRAADPVALAGGGAPVAMPLAIELLTADL